MKESPYSMLHEAEEKMMTMVLDLDPVKEERVVKLINSAASFPYMSRYQITKARVFLIDLYISHKIYGNAYDLCRMALDDYPKAPVKRKLRELEKIKEQHPGDFVYSKNIDMVDPELCYVDSSSPKTVVDAEYEEQAEALGLPERKLLP